MESRPKTIVRHPTRSLDQNLPYIGELMKYGQITIGNVRPVGCVAVAHDGRQTVSMLLRREGETVTQLLTRLDLAVGKRHSHRRGQPNQPTIHLQKIMSISDSWGSQVATSEAQRRCQCGLKRTLTEKKLTKRMRSSKKKTSVFERLMCSIWRTRTASPSRNSGRPKAIRPNTPIVIKEFVSSRGIQLEYSDAIYPAQGQCSSGKIVTLPGQGVAEEFATLAHEVAHSLLHQGEQRTEMSKRVRETESGSRGLCSLRRTRA